jgi:hypothetical protein
MNMTFTRGAALAALLVCCAGPARAQAVTLEFHDGRVNLTAQNASLRAILAEWARLGGTEVVNADRLGGAPVTLQLTDVPETQALDIVLRGTAGYIAGQRRTAESATRSSLDRIMVVPTAGTASTIAARPATPPPFVQQPQPIIQPDPDDDPVSDVPPEDERPTRRVPPPIRVVAPDGRVVSQPFIDDEPAPQPTPQVPTNPFGVQTGSSRPGMITPAPPQPDQQQNAPDPEP